MNAFVVRLNYFTNTCVDGNEDSSVLLNVMALQSSLFKYFGGKQNDIIGISLLLVYINKIDLQCDFLLTEFGQPSLRFGHVKI